MTGRLEGKVAVVTGGCSGIGLATAELFIVEGARVVVADLQDAKGRDLEARFDGALAYRRCDVTCEMEMVAALDHARDAFGGLDILFNNAGLSDRANTVAEIEAESWDAIFALLVRAPVLAIKRAAPMMADRGGGSIINTASVAALQAGLSPLGYAAAKAALLQFTRAAAPELARRNIRLNAVCPGLIATSIFGATFGMPRSAADQLAARVAELAPDAQPLARAGQPADIAEAVLYLASDAARFVTGTHLVVDGGLTLGPRHAWDPDSPGPLQGLFNGVKP
jgi:NAD(P)-dependent dehydrogenase (short-subunit alcohol dehydrogenase family)